jgi:hypothetical protein
MLAPLTRGHFRRNRLSRNRSVNQITNRGPRRQASSLASSSGDRLVEAGDADMPAKLVLGGIL